MLNNLYKTTPMQATFGVILLAVLNNQPKVFNLRELLQHFIDHRKEVVVRRTRYDLARARERAHILEGLVIALDNLDEVIRLIRAAENPQAARETLMEKFELSQAQAQAILDMRLHRLTGLERDKIVEEYRALLERIAHLEQVLQSDDMVLDMVVDELDEIKAKYADPRRTEIREDEEEISIEDLIAEEDMAITVSRDGYIKRSGLPENPTADLGCSGECWCGAYKCRADFEALLEIHPDIFDKLVEVEKAQRGKFTFVYEKGERVPLAAVKRQARDTERE